MNLILLLAFALDPLPVEGRPTGVLAADLNGDRHVDLVVMRDGGLTTLLRTNNTWRLAAKVPAPGELVAMVSADFNGDGHTDVAVADHDTFGIQLFFGDGQGGLRRHAIVRAKATGAPHVHGLLAGDLDQDGKADLVFVSSGEGELIPLRNAGAGNFSPLPAVKVGRRAWYPLMADLSGDGHLDIAAADLEGQHITVVLGDGRGGFHPAPGSPHASFPRSFSVKAGDVTGDGQLDLLAVHDDHGKLTVLAGDGRGGFRPLAGSPFEIGRECYGLEPVDLDGDGKLDVALAAGEELRVFWQKAGRLVGPVKKAAGVGGFLITRADFDGDGKEEIAIADAARNRVVFFGQ